MLYTALMAVFIGKLYISKQKSRDLGKTDMFTDGRMQQDYLNISDYWTRVGTNTGKTLKVE